MNTIISDGALRGVEQGILGLLLALGATCVFLFAWSSTMDTYALTPWKKSWIPS